MKLKKMKDENFEKIINISNQCIDNTLPNGSNTCGKCIEKCHMLKYYKISPKTYFEEVKKYTYIDPEIPFSCNMCGDCKIVCPKNIDLASAFYAMRIEILNSNEGISPISGHKAVLNHQKLSFSKIFSSSNKMAPSINNYGFMAGCSLSSYSPKLVKKTFNHLNTTLGNVQGVLTCCGKPTIDIGKIDDFNSRYNILKNEFENLGVNKVITACQNCYNVVKENSKDKEVLSLWELFPIIGLPKSQINIGKDSKLTFEIHHSCPTRHNVNIKNGIKWIIEELGYNLIESNDDIEKITCCGMGGMAATSNNELAKETMKKKASQYKADVLVVYCASCKDAMNIGGKESIHILDLIFNDPITNKDMLKIKNNNVITNWYNRFKTKLIVTKY